MKAREYAKLYQANPTNDTMADILTSFLKEASELVKVRHAQTNEAATAILSEQERKWQALSRLCPDIPAGLFAAFIKDDNPEVYRVWKGK